MGLSERDRRGQNNGHDGGKKPYSECRTHGSVVDLFNERVKGN